MTSLGSSTVCLQFLGNVFPSKHHSAHASKVQHRVCGFFLPLFFSRLEAGAERPPDLDFGSKETREHMNKPHNTSASQQIRTSASQQKPTTGNQQQPQSKGLIAPAKKEEVPDRFDEERDHPRLDQACLSLDRIDLHFASKEACRQMSNPRVSGEARMKRIARYPKLLWK